MKFLENDKQPGNKNTFFVLIFDSLHTHTTIIGLRVFQELSLKSDIKEMQNLLKLVTWSTTQFFCEILNYFFLDGINQSRFLNYRYFYFAIFGWWVDRYWGRGVGNFTQFGKFNLCSIRLRKSGWFNQVSPIAQNDPDEF